MQDKEQIPVWILVVKGKTVCICHRYKKGCKNNCTADTVTRDKFAGWENGMKRNKYGR